MRVLLTADAELPVPPTLYGGIERIVASLATRLRALGHQVALAAHRDSTVQVDAFFPWPGNTSTRLRDSWRNARALRQAVRQFEPDILHSFSRLLWLLPLVADPRPRVMSYQREPAGRTVRWSNALHGNRLRFTGCSRFICDQGRRRGGGQWTPIPNFVDLADFTFQPKVPHDAPLVFLSRIERIKGLHLAIAIARQTGRRLLIAGNPVPSGDSARYWREEIKPQVGRNGIEFLGPVDNSRKNELLGKAAALLVPVQWAEPFGIVFVEALACGTPVISCPDGALPEIVRSGREGFLIQNVDQGCDAVAGLPGIQRSACRQRVQARFTSEIVADQYVDLYTRSPGAGTAGPRIMSDGPARA